VRSRAKATGSMPLFIEGDTITGSVVLDLVSKKKLKGVTLTLEGETLRVGEEPLVFYKDTRPLWTPDANETKASNLSGSVVWPFSMSLPREVHVASTSKGIPNAIKAPPSFTDRASPAYIDYRLIVTFRRGALRVNQVLTASLSYVLLTRIPPLSALRLAAYEAGGQMAGPNVEAADWKSLNPIKLKGTSFGNRSIEVEYTFAVGAPLIYAPNSPVPLWITIAGADEQVTALLISSKSVSVQLRRSLAIGLDADDDGRVERTDTTFLELCARGVIWPPSDNLGAKTVPAKHVLEGELFIPAKTKPSFIFPNVSLRYFVDFSLAEIPGLSFPGHIPNKPLASQKIDIALDSSHRRNFSSRAPPSYALEQSTRYDTSIGVLTAANQRFLHHGHSGV